jgi:GT2 family glycosyltransferase
LNTLIVVLNWNSREMTRDCIQSLLAMEGDSFQILLIDNGSQDGSVEYLQEAFPNIQVIANGRNLGFAAGCNIGMDRALREGYDYVLLVNNDTIIDPMLLRELRGEAGRCPTAGMLSPKIYYFEPSDQLWWAGGTYNSWSGIPAHAGRKQVDAGQFDQSRNIDWATGCVLLLCCAALRATGLFDEQFFGNGEDLDLSLRMRKHGYVVRYAPKAIVWHREGIDYQKNVGEYVRAFTLVRNLLWVMHKHGKAYHWLTFWPVFMGYYLPRMTLVFLSRGDSRSCLALWQGFAAFWKMLLNPGSSVLPLGLKATMQPVEAGDKSVRASLSSRR